MKAIITQKSELTLNLTQHFIFDVLTDGGEAVLISQSIECSPSNAVEEIKAKLESYQQEYTASQELEIGMEIS